MPPLAFGSCGTGRRRSPHDAGAPRSFQTARTPAQYVAQAPTTVAAKPTVRSLNPAMQLVGITNPSPITTVGSTNQSSGRKYFGFIVGLLAVLTSNASAWPVRARRQ